MEAARKGAVRFVCILCMYIYQVCVYIRYTYIMSVLVWFKALSPHQLRDLSCFSLLSRHG